MEHLFDFKCCWTCQHSILDIGIGRYICRKKQINLAKMNQRAEMHIPTKCNKWNHK